MTGQMRNSQVSPKPIRTWNSPRCVPVPPPHRPGSVPAMRPALSSSPRRSVLHWATASHRACLPPCAIVLLPGCVRIGLRLLHEDEQLLTRGQRNPGFGGARRQREDDHNCRQDSDCPHHVHEGTIACGGTRCSVPHALAEHGAKTQKPFVKIWGFGGAIC